MAQEGTGAPKGGTGDSQGGTGGDRGTQGWHRCQPRPLCPHSSKPSWADQVEEEGGEDDKVITSELLKDLPLPGVLGGASSAEAELLKGGPLPSPKEVVNGNIKTITEYREEEDGRKVKVGTGAQVGT
uniref:eukaryotic translation initiation factor 3 subunit G-like n=1 Tax=Lonchura striata TaxID=40157 RepID=UPI000B4D53CF